MIANPKRENVYLILLGVVCIALAVSLLKSCDRNEVLIDSSIKQTKLNKSVLKDLERSDNIINSLNEKIVLKQNKIDILTISIAKSESKTKEEIKKVDNYDLNDFKNFYSNVTGSNEIEIKENTLTFTKAPLDTLAKIVIYSAQYKDQRDIYREVWNISKEQGVIKDTIINIQKEIIVDLSSNLTATDKINNDLTKQLKRASKPKFGQILIGVGIGIISGLLIQK